MGLDQAIVKLKRREALSAAEMDAAMSAIISGTETDSAIEEFLLVLREKGETAEEITAAALVMRRHAVKLTRRHPGLLDTCGTGGDARNTLNVSTLSAITAAAAGARVAKHGNRSVSSVCGSADLLELLGVKIDLEPETLDRCLDETGFAFLFAPKFHPATRFAMNARKKIQGKTLFNVLGPLSNPAGADYQIVGVYEEKLTSILAEVLLKLGVRRALVVHGLDGMDEITLCAETAVAEIQGGAIKKYRVSPELFGLKRADISALECRTKEKNKTVAMDVFKGEKGPAADIVALNAGAALYAAGRVESIQAGVLAARKAVESGGAMQKLKQIVSFTYQATLGSRG